jgi:hypothetical protein
MKLSLYQYNALTNDEKVLVLQEYGKPLTRRTEKDWDIELFGLFDFYVEVMIKEPDKEDVKLRTFRSISVLEPYLEQIKLDI